VVNILRTSREEENVSADVFEKLFLENMGSVFSIDIIPFKVFFDEFLGPVNKPLPMEESETNLLKLTEGYDLFCPAFEAIPLTPSFLKIRNRSHANIRLLFIAHAPGIFIYEWALFHSLLRKGDIIIAPSRSAKEVIEFLCPELSGFINIAHHPMNVTTAVPSKKSGSKKRIVSMYSIHEPKLIHRQIEAMDILKKRGHDNIRMEIAGDCNMLNSDEESAYGYLLRKKIDHLKLQNEVSLTGILKGGEAKKQFLAYAHMMICLSGSVEEAFPKSSIEGLSMGLPVIATYWDGFIETVGDAGILIPVHIDKNGKIDIAAEKIADAIEELLNDPIPAEKCVNQAIKFSASTSAELYKRIMEDSFKEFTENGNRKYYPVHKNEAKDSKGLIGKISIFKAFSDEELFDLYLEYAERIRNEWQGITLPEICNGVLLHGISLESTRKDIEKFVGKINNTVLTFPIEMNTDFSDIGNIFLRKIAKSILLDTTLVSKEICLYLLLVNNYITHVEKILDFFQKKEIKSNGLEYIRIETEIKKNDHQKALSILMKENIGNDIQEGRTRKLRQLARISRGLNKPEFALDSLRAYLAKYPYSTGSDDIWYELACNLVSAGDYSDEAEVCLKEAKGFFGESPEIVYLENQISCNKVFSFI
jgi:glycosyltransferase involved in cell wall biosynthesis